MWRCLPRSRITRRGESGRKTAGVCTEQTISTAWPSSVACTPFRSAARVSAISEEIVDPFRRKGVPEHKLILFPNTLALPEESTIPVKGAFRQKNGFGPEEFLSVYAGNLGVKQGLDVLLETALLVR